MPRFTGRNRDIAKWLGEPLDEFKDPGFCLGCGEVECECDQFDNEDEEEFDSRNHAQ